MIHVLKSFASKLWLALLLLIILGGIFIGATRLLLPIATEYRQEVQELVSAELGQKVEIGQLKTSWRGYGPELILGNVLLLDPESGLPSLRISEARIGIGILDSLRNRAITPRQITFYRTRMLIKYRSDGSVMLAGLEDMEHSSGDSSAAFLLPFRINLKQSEIFWENQSIKAAPVHFTDVDFSITNDENRHQVKASMRLPGKAQGRVQLIADIQGEIQTPGAWFGEVYLRGSQLAIPTILNNHLPEGYTFQTGQAGMELWSNWDKGRISSMQGAIDFQNLKLASDRQIDNTGIKPIELERIGGRFNWQRTDAGWLLDVADIDFIRNGQAWPKSNLSLASSYDQQGHMELVSALEFVRIKDILAAIPMFPLPSKELDRTLNSIQPEADLHSLQLRFQETPEGPRWSGRGRLEDISITPWQSIPGINGLDARFWLDQDQGTIALEGKSLTSSLPQLFREKIKLDELHGRIQLKRNPGQGWTLETERLIANNQDIKTTTRMRLMLPQDPTQPQLLDLQTDFRNGDVSATPRYLPTTIMPDDVVAWLDKSLINGRVPDGSAIYRGALDRFPFPNNTGHFEVLFRVDDMVLNYDPEWPQISQLAAELRFHNNSLDIWASQGAMLDSRLHNLHGRIDDLENASPLKITGSASGPLDDELKLLTQTPLSDDFGTFAKPIGAKGKAELALNLSLPLDEGDFRIKGKLSLQDSTLTVKKSKVALNKIHGTLEFSETGVTAKDIKCTLLGEKIKLNITPIKKSSSTMVKAYGAISGSRLNQHFPNLGLEQLDGRSNWSVKFEIPSLQKNRDKMYTKITASSDLVGTAIKQPAPIGKGKQQKRHLSLSTTISNNPLKHLQIDYGRVFSGDLFISSNKQGAITLERGSVILGGGKARAPKTRQLLLGGGLKRLDISPWLNNTRTKSQLSLPKIKGENLHFGTLKFGDTILNNTKINFAENKRAISGKINSSLMTGNIRIPLPYKSKPIDLNLDQLSIKLNQDKQSTSLHTGTNKADSTDPRALPGIILSSKKLVINGKNLGPLKIAAKRTPGGLILEQMKISSKRLNITAHGNWTRKANKTQSHIRVKGKTDSLGKLLTVLGFAPNLKQAPAKIEANLRWSGSPHQFSKTDVSGHMKMRIGKGRFLDVDPGLGRVFGLLNISALQRRLTMDFSDTFKKGFSFDKAEGVFELDSGDAYTNDLMLESPSALIEITGRTGLVSQDFDQLVMVTPSISSTIPIAGALAGGPAVGAALLLAQKLIGKQVDKVSTTRYTITGPWDKPNIIKQKAHARRNR
ncbi:MAG: TIGR02099 family protein [Gammaproteobacteria bacterium]|nr:TIGR02099 family protein [Gammaproteobacteria bacterium]